MRFSSIPQFPCVNYRVNVPWVHLRSSWLDQHDCNLDPPYQRGYVWTIEQQQAYVTYILRGGPSGRSNLVAEADVIHWYLGMNTGGSMHTRADLEPAYSRLREIYGQGEA